VLFSEHTAVLEQNL